MYYLILQDDLNYENGDEPIIFKACLLTQFAVVHALCENGIEVTEKICDIIVGMKNGQICEYTTAYCFKDADAKITIMKFDSIYAV